MASHNELGQKGEKIAEKHLLQKGYEILDRNFRFKRDEIDLIAAIGDQIVFVEVKARMSEKYGNPKESVTFNKQKKISIAAQYYLKERKKMDSRARFDVVAINIINGKLSIEVLKNAFEYAR